MMPPVRHGSQQTIMKKIVSGMEQVDALWQLQIVQHSQELLIRALHLLLLIVPALELVKLGQIVFQMALFATKLLVLILRLNAKLGISYA